jgi:hypothetical protein
MVVGWLREFGGQFVKWIIETVQKYGPDFGRFMKIIGNAIGIVWDVATKIYDAFKPLIEFFLLILEVVINLLRAGLRLAELAHVADIIAMAFGLLFAPINLVLEIVKRVAGWINDMFTMLADSSVGQAVSRVFGVIGDAVLGVAGWVDKIVSGIKWLAEKASWLFGGDNTVIVSPTPGQQAAAAQRNDLMSRGFTSSGQPLNPALTAPRTGNPILDAGRGASGAVVTRPTRALIGESGPEAVVPLSATRGSRRLNLNNKQNSSIQIQAVHVHGVQSLDQFVTEVQKYVSNLPRESSTGMSIG